MNKDLPDMRAVWMKTREGRQRLVIGTSDKHEVPETVGEIAEREESGAGQRAYESAREQLEEDQIGMLERHMKPLSRIANQVMKLVQTDKGDFLIYVDKDGKPQHQKLKERFDGAEKMQEVPQRRKYW